MRTWITWSLLTLCLLSVPVQARHSDDSGRGHHRRHRSEARGSDLRPTPGRVYNNPEYYQFDSLYNPYYRKPYWYYPSFGWGYSPWFGYWPGVQPFTNMSIGTGYANSWYPGWMWF